MNHLTDQFGRYLHYLRISLTDRCNFRCTYCMPPEGISLLPREDVLRLEEFERLVRVFVSLGVDKVRLTGGEPLLRKKIIALVASLARIDGLTDVCLTTNGSLLAPLADELKQAGLKGVNVSLDSLDPKRFSRITLRDEFPKVMEGITQALKVGLKVKLNVVALSDLGKNEVISFCKLTQQYPLEIRFLEFMPLCGTGYSPELALPIQNIRDWIDAEFDITTAFRGKEVAETFKIKDAVGKLGFIASITEPFCDTCTRLRLTSTGMMRLCLFSDLETDLRLPLRAGATEAELAAIIKQAAWFKPRGNVDYLAQKNYDELPKIRTLGG